MRRHGGLLQHDTLLASRLAHHVGTLPGTLTEPERHPAAQVGKSKVSGAIPAIRHAK